MVWLSSNKNNGFIVSFDAESPFDPDDTIVGGGQKAVTTKASTRAATSTMWVPFVRGQFMG